MGFTRRTTLLATGTAMGLAGCLEDLTSDDQNGTDTPDDGNPDQPTVEVFQLGSAPGQPWWTTDAEATGFVTLLESEHDQPWMVDEPDAVDGLAAWLEDTDFDRSVVVYVETAAPSACYSELAVSDVAVADDAVVGTAEAVDTSGEDETCATVESYPSAFVRVTADGLPAGARFTVTDGWGESSEVAADGRYIDPDGLPGHVQPDGDPPKVPGFSCDQSGFERLPGPDGSVSLGEAHNDEELTFAMRFHGTQAVTAGDDGDSPTVGRGHEVRITMRNVSTDVRVTGNRHKYSLQVLTTEGWRDVRGTTDGDPIGYTDEGIAHRPGTGFEWTFTMTEDGVVAEGHPHEDRLTVCPDLPSGRYRFVYHEAGGEALAVQFDYRP